jgi:hypothetical protein
MVNLWNPFGILNAVQAMAPVPCSHVLYKAQSLHALSLLRAHPQAGDLVCVLSLGIRFVVFNETAVAIVLFLVVRRRHPAHAIRTPRGIDIALGCLLGDCVTRIDPVGIHVDGRAEVVDVGLEGLAADLTLQVADTGLLFDGDADGLFVVAEEALECRREFLLLRRR